MKPLTIQDLGYPKLTVGKLKELLSKFDDSLPVVTRGRNTDGDTDSSFESYWPDFKYPMASLQIEERQIKTSPWLDNTIPALVIGIFQ
jgi:hypothetical protein